MNTVLQGSVLRRDAPASPILQGSALWHPASVNPVLRGSALRRAASVNTVLQGLPRPGTKAEPHPRLPPDRDRPIWGS
jgi:hypothetical protein